MRAAWSLALRHSYQSDVPMRLWRHAARLRFARWLVLTGRLSDWDLAAERVAGEIGRRNERAVALLSQDRG